MRGDWIEGSGPASDYRDSKIDCSSVRADKKKPATKDGGRDRDHLGTETRRRQLKETTGDFPRGSEREVLNRQGNRGGREDDTVTTKGKRVRNKISLSHNKKR